MSDTSKYTLLLAFTLAAGASPGAAQAAGNQGSGATIKCWKNDIGIRECGSFVPPEYSQKRIEVLNDRGLVVKVIEPPKTREQLEKEREQEREHKAQEAARKKQQQEDNILLDSYATERDLIMARDTNVSAAKAELDIAEGNLKMQQNALVDLQNRAGDFERSGRKPPKTLIGQINQTKQQIADKQKVIDSHKQDINAMEQRFDRDLARFRKLKGLSN